MLPSASSWWIAFSKTWKQPNSIAGPCLPGMLNILTFSVIIPFAIIALIYLELFDLDNTVLDVFASRHPLARTGEIHYRSNYS